jgi:hypothetical protein
VTSGPETQRLRDRKRREIAEWIEIEVGMVEVIGGNWNDPPTACKVCAPYERKRFPITKAPITPFHDGCRCDTIAIVE